MRSRNIILYLTMIVIVILSTTSESTYADDNLWEITCSEINPLIGDEVIFEIESLYRGEYVILIVEVINTTGHRADIDIIRINEWGTANWTWRSDLDDEPGKYDVIFKYKSREVADFVIILVYDELDWMVKYTYDLERRLQRQNERIMEAAIIATESRETVVDYIVSPGLIAIFTSIINIFLIFTVGTKYYIDVINERMRRSKNLSWISHALSSQTDGNFNRMQGYSDVNEPDMELTDEEFVKTSERYLNSRIRIVRLAKIKE